MKVSFMFAPPFRQFGSAQPFARLAVQGSDEQPLGPIVGLVVVLPRTFKAPGFPKLDPVRRLIARARIRFNIHEGFSEK